MSNIIGEAVVRVRSLTDGFRQDTQRGVKQGLAGVFAGSSGAGLLKGAGLAGLGTALGLELRKSVEEGLEAERVQVQLANAVNQTGREYERYADRIDDAIQKQAELGAFDDEELASTFTVLFRRTNDWTKALELNSLAMDVARGRGIELSQAANLVLRAANGQAGALRRLGIEARAGADAQELLGLLQEKYAGSAAAFGETSAGSYAKLGKAIGDARELLGGLVNTNVKPFAEGLTEVVALGTALAEAFKDDDGSESLLGRIAKEAYLSLNPLTSTYNMVTKIRGALNEPTNPVVPLPGGDRENRAALATSQAAAAARDAAVEAAKQARGLDERSRAEFRLRAATRAGDLKSALAEANTLLEIARQRVAVVKRVGPLLKERKEEEQDALDTVDTIQDQIAADAARRATDRANDARQAADDRRSALAQDRADAEQALINNVERAKLTDRKLSDDRAALAKLISYYRAKKANTALERAERLDAARGEIDARRELRELGKGGPEDTLAAREGALAARESAADLTPTLLDDVKVARGRVRLYRTELRNAIKDVTSTKAERDELRTKWNEAKGDLKSILVDRDEQEFEGQELELANNLRAAGLTKGLSDDVRAARKSIRFYETELRQAQSDVTKTKTERQKLREKVLEAKEDLQDLLNPKSKTGDKGGTSAFDLLQLARKQFAGGNVIGGAQPFAGMAGFTDDIEDLLRRNPTTRSAGPSGFMADLSKVRSGLDTSFGSRNTLDLDDSDLVSAIDRLIAALTGRADPDRPKVLKPGSIDLNDRRWREASQTRKAVEADA